MWRKTKQCSHEQVKGEGSFKSLVHYQRYKHFHINLAQSGHNKAYYMYQEHQQNPKIHLYDFTTLNCFVGS